MKNHNPTNVAWRKSSYSSQSGGNCVETAGLDPFVGVRDSKDVSRGVMTVAAAPWSALVDELKNV